MGSPLLCFFVGGKFVPGTVLGANKMARWSARCRISSNMNSDDESSVQQDEEIDRVLELAVEYAVRRSYPPGLTKKKKTAVRKRASTLVVEKGEVFLKKKGRLVKVVTAVEEQRRILESCHSDPTSGHFGTTKTWRRVAERFYWRGMSKQVKELVSRGYEL